MRYCPGMTKAQLRRRLEAGARFAGPQVPGGRYLCSYWQRTYTVVAMGTMVDGGWPWITVRWDDTGEVATHCTAWDRRDRVVA
jgi:hypothetical protein